VSIKHLTIVIPVDGIDLLPHEIEDFVKAAKKASVINIEVARQHKTHPCETISYSFSAENFNVKVGI